MLIAPIADACCTIYDNVTHNCTVVRTDRFRLVPNASASLEVEIDSALSTIYINLIDLLSIISFKSHSANLSISKVIISCLLRLIHCVRYESRERIAKCTSTAFRSHRILLASKRERLVAFTSMC